MKRQKNPYPRLLGRAYPNVQLQDQAAELKIGQGFLGVKMPQANTCF